MSTTHLLSELIPFFVLIFSITKYIIPTCLKFIYSYKQNILQQLNSDEKDRAKHQYEQIKEKKQQFSTVISELFIDYQKKLTTLQDQHKEDKKSLKIRSIQICERKLQKENDSSKKQLEKQLFKLIVGSIKNARFNTVDSILQKIEVELKDKMPMTNL